MKQAVISEYQKKAADILAKAGIVITDSERKNMEIADFGLGDMAKTGLAIINYINTDRVCAKELIMMPRQTCPEHRHGAIQEKNYVGKEETFRCRAGAVWLYVEGEPARNPVCAAPAGDEEWYTVWHEIRLLPGEQYTLRPDTPHWFQAGDEGAIVSEFSTPSFDEFDIFTNPNIRRVPSWKG